MADVGGPAAGSALAKDLILTARVIDADEARRIGIVSRVVPHERLADEADDIATIADRPWPSSYFALVAIDSGPRLDPRRAAELEGIADQVMVREKEVEEFMAEKGLNGLER